MISAGLQKRLGFLLLVVKFLVAFGSLFWLLRIVDLDRAYAMIKMVSPLSVVASVALLMLQALVSAWRWSLISVFAGSKIPIAPLLRYFLISLFWNQVLPSPLPGDVARVWGAMRSGPTLGEATLGVLLDRLLTLAGLAVMAFAGLMAMRLVYGLTLPIPFLSEMLGAGLLVLAVAVLLLTSGSLPIAALETARLKPFVSALGALFSRPSAVPVFVLTLVSHGMGVLALHAVAIGLGLPLGWGAGFAAYPIVLLFAVLPVSVGGWGVRESGMVISLAGFGIGPTDAASLSVLFGLCQLMIGLIGGLCLLLPSKASSQA